jgi:hypothetical protein
MYKLFYNMFKMNKDCLDIILFEFLPKYRILEEKNT